VVDGGEFSLQLARPRPEAVAESTAMDKLDAMQTFVRVAEAGSFTAVADQLQVARSAVTRQIAALEKELHVKLITRSTRSLALTPAGAAYLEKCRVILNMVDAAEGSLNEEKAEARGRIRLGLPISFGLQRLMPALLEFAKAQPHVELMMDFSDQRANLIEEGIDLSIRITGNLQPGDIVRQLGQVRLLTLASPAYLSAHGQPREPQDLAQHTCLLYGMTLNSATWAYRVNGHLQTVAVRGRIHANNGLALTQAAAQGMGITLQPDFIAAPFLATGELVEVLQDFGQAPMGIYAVLPSNRYIPHRVNVLLEHLAARLRSS
jgi:DNA-binding transcriptional LysR family regulator